MPRSAYSGLDRASLTVDLTQGVGSLLIYNINHDDRRDEQQNREVQQEA